MIKKYIYILKIIYKNKFDINANLYFYFSKFKKIMFYYVNIINSFFLIQKQIIASF